MSRRYWGMAGTLLDEKDVNLSQQTPALRAQGSGLKAQGSGLRVQGSEFRVQGSGFRVGVTRGFRALCSSRPLPKRVWHSGFKGYGFGFGVTKGFRAWCFVLQGSWDIAASTSPQGRVWLAGSGFRVSRNPEVHRVAATGIFEKRSKQTILVHIAIRLLARGFRRSPKIRRRRAQVTAAPYMY